MEEDGKHGSEEDSDDEIIQFLERSSDPKHELGEDSDDKVIEFLERSTSSSDVGLGQMLAEDRMQFFSQQKSLVIEENYFQITNVSQCYDRCTSTCDFEEHVNNQQQSKRRCSGLALIERPLTFDSSLDFSNESRSKILLKQMDWYFPILDRYREAGYLVDPMVRVFRSIPRDLEDAIKQGLRALQIIKSSSEAAQIRRPSQTTQFPNPVAEDLAAFPNTEDIMWEARADCGYLRLEWDPVTQRRRRAVMNTAFAAINGMHPEEAVARIANREAALGRTNEVDPFRAPLHRITLHPDRWSVLALRQLARHARLIFLLSSLRTPLLL